MLRTKKNFHKIFFSNFFSLFQGDKMAEEASSQQIFFSFNAAKAAEQIKVQITPVLGPLNIFGTGLGRRRIAGTGKPYAKGGGIGSEGAPLLLNYFLPFLP